MQRLAERLTLDPTKPLRAQRSAAVAIVLQDEPDPLDCLFIQRPVRETDRWSGHIAFPGGQHEPQDATLLDTAVRETFEEVGLRLRSEYCLGQLEDICATSRQGSEDLVVRPFVFYFPEAIPPLILNPDEAADALWLPVEELQSGGRDTHYRFEQGKRKLNFPAYRLDAERSIWGMTYRMLRLLFPHFE